MTLNKRDKLLLSVLAAVAAIGGLYWFVVKPAKADAQAKRDQLSMVQSDNANLQDQLTRLTKQQTGAQDRMIDAFAMSKAVPARPQVDTAIVQLQSLAKQSNVTLMGVRTSATTVYPNIAATELSVVVKGRYFDVDDFMFRLHRQVTLDERSAPRVEGRLFATKAVDMDLTTGDSEDPAPAGTVETELKVLVFTDGGTATPVAAPSAPAPMSPKAAEQKSINAINATNNSAGGTP
ncbi:MAG: type II secretion system protein M [Thermoleophilia bacterium]|nr:type II secretion system protein M [Thermoleophilia bacterium]